MDTSSIESRRTMLATMGLAALAVSLSADERLTKHIVLRSSWQTVNIGDVAHTAGMLALLESHRPEAKVTLWPSSVDRGVDKILKARFPNVQIALTKDDKNAALAECNFFLHGSGPGLVGAAEAELAQKAGIPYGFAGITLNDDEIKQKRGLLAGAKFVFTRDTDSLKALKASGLPNPNIDFGPDATFALDLRDDPAAEALLKEHRLEAGKFLCAIPRLRWTP